MIFICNDPEKKLNYYYSKSDSKIYVMYQEGRGASAGIVAGLSLLLYALIRKLNVYIVLVSPNSLYLGTIILGVIFGIILNIYLKRRLIRKIQKTAYEYNCGAEEVKKMVTLGKKQFYAYLCMVAGLLIIESICRDVLIELEPRSLVYAFMHVVYCGFIVIVIGGLLISKPFGRLRFYRENS